MPKTPPDCDGVICGHAFVDHNGQMIKPGPHWHLVISGQDPEASVLCYAIKTAPENKKLKGERILRDQAE